MTSFDNTARPSTRPVTLIGLPGVGKSTIGRRLARQLGRDFYDTDLSVVERVGCSIAELFDREGEPAFRRFETEALSSLIAVRPPAIIATGGGIVVDEASRAMLAASSVAVYLQARPQDLARRLQRDTTRPLLRHGGVLENLLRLAAHRDPLYRSVAAITVEVADISPSAIVARVLAELAVLERGAALQLQTPT